MVKTTKKEPKKIHKTDDQKIHFLVTKREIFGKKVKKLRREKILPANIYGNDFKSLAVQMPILDFKKILKSAGETNIIYLSVGSDKTELPVLIQNISTHPVNGNYLHVDFRKVDLKKKIQTSVPVKTIGESPAVAQNIGMLQISSNMLTIEALPDEIPNHIEIDVTQLNNIGDEISISQIKPTGNFIFVDDPSKVIARVIEHKEEEITPQVQEPVAEEDQAAGTTEDEKKDESGEKKTAEETPAES